MTRFIIKLFAVSFMLVTISCSLDTPATFTPDNPMDPNNPYPPRTPTNLTAVALSSSSVRLQWKDMSGNEEGVEIEESLLDNRNWTPLTTTAASETTYTVTGLQPFTTYFYRVRAANRFGKSLYSNETSVTTPNAPPAAPTALQVASVSSRHVELSWQDNSVNEDGCVIERKSAPLNQWAELKRTGANETANRDSTVLPATVYTYRVRAFNSEGYSDYTGEVTAATVDVEPAAPSGLQAFVVSAREIDLLWQDNSANENGFAVFRRMGVGGAWAEIGRNSYNQITYKDSTLLVDTTYFYRVRAFNDVGESPFSNEAAASNRQTPPAAPTQLSAFAASAAQIDLLWRDNSFGESGFKLERRSGADTIWTEIAQLGPDVVYHVDAELAPNSLYRYRVRAFNPFGLSAYSNEAEARTRQTAPLAPLDLEVITISDSQLQLMWTEISNNEDGFVILRGLTSNAMSAIDTLEANTATFLDGDLESNTEYFYTIFAFNEAGNSMMSNLSSGRTESGVETVKGLLISGGRGLWLYDISIPAEPRYISHSNYNGYRFELADSIVYLRTDNGINLIKIDNKMEFSYLSFIGNRHITDFALSANVAYVISYRALTLFGVFNANHPRFISLLESPDGINSNITIFGSFAIIATYSPSGIRFVNISDRNNPQEVNRWQLENLGDPDDIELVGNSVFIGDGNGIHIVDIQNVMNPSVIGTISLQAHVYDVEVASKFAFLANGERGLRIYAISNLQEPHEVGYVNFNGSARVVVVDGEFAYVSVYQGYDYFVVYVIDIRNKIYPVVIADFSVPGIGYDLDIIEFR